MLPAEFCPINPQERSSASNNSEHDLFDFSSNCRSNTKGNASDQIWITEYPLLTTHFRLSGDNATMLVEQFMQQEMNRTVAGSAWEYFGLVNRTNLMINATDESNIAQTRMLSIPAIIIDYWHSQGPNDFRNVEMYTIHGGKGYVVRYLPSTDIPINGDRVVENRQGFYPPVVHDILMTFSPIKSAQ